MNKRNGNSDLAKYYKQIKLNLPYSKQASSLINNLKFSIAEYTDKHPCYTIQEIIDIFGTPEEIVESFILSLNSAEYKKNISVKKIIFTGIISFVLLFLLVYAIAYIRGRNLIAIYETNEVIKIHNSNISE